MDHLSVCQSCLDKRWLTDIYKPNYKPPDVPTCGGFEISNPEKTLNQMQLVGRGRAENMQSEPLYDIQWFKALSSPWQT